MINFIHPTAIIDEGAQIGTNTTIWHWSHICSGARIGDGCTFGQNVFVGNDVHIGKNVKVQNNVSIYDRVHLEDDVFCGPSMVFTNVLNPRAHINRKNEYKPTMVKKGATLGANCTILCGVSIGEYAFIGAGAVITKDVKSFALMTGVPGEQTGWVSSCGLKLNLPLNGQANAMCKESGLSYHLDGDKLFES